MRLRQIKLLAQLLLIKLKRTKNKTSNSNGSSRVCLQLKRTILTIMRRKILSYQALQNKKSLNSHYCQSGSRKILNQQELCKEINFTGYSRKLSLMIKINSKLNKGYNRGHLKNISLQQSSINAIVPLNCHLEIRIDL